MNNLADLMGLVEKIDEMEGEKEILITDQSPVTGKVTFVAFFGFDPNDPKQQQLKKTLAAVLTGQNQVGGEIKTTKK